MSPARAGRSTRCRSRTTRSRSTASRSATRCRSTRCRSPPTRSTSTVTISTAADQVGVAVAQRRQAVARRPLVRRSAVAALASIGRATARPGPAPGGVGALEPTRRRPARPLARRASRGHRVSGAGPRPHQLGPERLGWHKSLRRSHNNNLSNLSNLKRGIGYLGHRTDHDPRLTHGSPASRACTNAGGDLGAQRSQRSQGCYCARGRGTSNLLDPAPTCARSTPRLLVDGAPIGAVASR